MKVGIGIVNYMSCIWSASLLGPLEYSYSKRVQVFIHIWSSFIFLFSTVFYSRRTTYPNLVSSQTLGPDKRLRFFSVISCSHNWWLTTGNDLKVNVPLASGANRIYASWRGGVYGDGWFIHHAWTFCLNWNNGKENSTLEQKTLCTLYSNCTAGVG